MPAIVTASVPTEVQGLPQPSDNFPRRFRSRAPLVIRQIIAHKVLQQWSFDPHHVVQALNQTAQIDNRLLGQGQEHLLEEEPLLPVMVAEDTKNFMDNPQFTQIVSMTAKDIVARVFVKQQQQQVDAGVEQGMDTASSTTLANVMTQQASVDAPVPDPHIHDAQTPTSVNTNNATLTGGAACPQRESHATQHTVSHHLSLGSSAAQDLLQRRFYYRGTMPASLYFDLQIPALLSSLSLPEESTAFARTSNRDLMRIWISLAGATTPLHYDRCHGILIQLVGRKRFVVFSHEDTNNLYPYDGIVGPGHASKVRGLGHCFPIATSSKLSLTTPTPISLQSSSANNDAHLKKSLAEVLERWPKIKRTDPWVIDLEPGDALYTPPGFWHEVTSVDNSISITIPWDMDANELQHVPGHMVS
ncbi:hypothetical protein EDD11_006817 [Mortierella claussenii]|nr:hypothetical protein EDD11_006817 [Mortierella claussenii]